MKRSLSALLATCLGLPFVAYAQPIDKPDTVNPKHELKKIPEVKLARWDKMYMELLENTEELGEDTAGIGAAIKIDRNDSLTAARLLSMSRKSPFSFPYNNKVQAFINLYLNKKRDLTQRMLGLSEFYYPEIEAALDKYGLPLELKHLVAVESAFNPVARSHAGAVGMWQFMYGTGKIYGLEVGSYVDERMDPRMATDAACRFLRDLYKMYGNWELALAAYNSGPGNVNKAIRYSGGHKNYWKIYNYLPRETRGYVPAFIAVNYIFEHHKELGITPILPELTYTQQIDTIHITSPWSLKEAAQTLQMDYDMLRALNPVLKGDFIPYLDQPFVLNLPYEKAIVYASKKKDLEKLKQLALKEEAKQTAVAASTATNVDAIHVVRRGENLSLISKLYGISVNDLKAVNGLRSSAIDVGQRLKVPSKGSKNTASNESLAPNRYLYYTIQAGDTLWDIAQKHAKISVDELRKLNHSVNVRNLKPGQKIIIGVKG